MVNFNTVCPRSFDPFYKVSYCIRWVKTSWTYSSVSGEYYIVRDTDQVVDLIYADLLGLFSTRVFFRTIYLDTDLGNVYETYANLFG